MITVTQEFGEGPGHPFRGNQYTDAEGFTGGEQVPEKFWHLAQPVSVDKLRRIAQYDAKSDTSDSLKADITANGVQKPVTVSYNPENGRTLVTDGNHRVAVAPSGTVVPVVVLVPKTNRIYRPSDIDVPALTAAAFAWDEFGEGPGHPFRGNQYTQGESSGDIEAKWDKLARARGMEPAASKAVAKAFADFERRAPHMAAHTDLTVGKFPADPATEAQTSFSKGRAIVDFNPIYVSPGHERERAEAVIRSALSPPNWTVTGDNLEAITAHELSHAAVAHLIAEGAIDGGEMMDGDLFFNRPGALTDELATLSLQHVRSGGQIDADGIAREISEYALSNPFEYVAEAYAQVHYTDAPSSDAVKISQWLDREVAGYERRHH